MTLIKYDKAIRDRIPEVIQADGKECFVEQVSAEEFLRRLITKLGEEAAECQATPGLEELADIVEVVRAVVGYLGHTWADLEQVRLVKVGERGAFEKRLVLKGVRGGSVLPGHIPNDPLIQR